MSEPGRRDGRDLRRSLHRILAILHVISIVAAYSIFAAAWGIRLSHPGVFIEQGQARLAVFVFSAVALLSGLGLLTVQSKVPEGVALAEGFALAISIVAAIFLLFAATTCVRANHERGWSQDADAVNINELVRPK